MNTTLFGALLSILPSVPMFAAPVAFAALGETVVQKAGVINIGLDGTMLLSAFTAVMVSLSTGNAYAGAAAGAAVGMAVGLISAVFTVKIGADQVVVGTAINLSALGLTSSLFRERFGGTGQLLSVAKVPPLYGLILLVVLIGLVAYALNHTRWGLATRAAGEKPKALEAAGFAVTRVRFLALGIGGLMGGLGGAFLSLAISGSFAENMTAGRGFVAIAMVTFGRWRPVWVFAAALLIGVAESLQFAFQGAGVRISNDLLLAFPYVLALLVLIVAGKGTLAPASLGQPYQREA